MNLSSMFTEGSHILESLSTTRTANSNIKVLPDVGQNAIIVVMKKGTEVTEIVLVTHLDCLCVLGKHHLEL